MTSGSVNTEDAGEREDARLVKSIDLPSILHLERGTTSRGKKYQVAKSFPRARGSGESSRTWTARGKWSYWKVVKEYVAVENVAFSVSKKPRDLKFPPTFPENIFSKTGLFSKGNSRKIRIGQSRKRERTQEGDVEKLGKETRQGARGNVHTDSPRPPRPAWDMKPTRPGQLGHWGGRQRPWDRAAVPKGAGRSACGSSALNREIAVHRKRKGSESSLLAIHHNPIREFWRGARKRVPARRRRRRRTATAC